MKWQIASEYIAEMTARCNRAKIGISHRHERIKQGSTRASTKATDSEQPPLKQRTFEPNDSSSTSSSALTKSPFFQQATYQSPETPMSKVSGMNGVSDVSGGGVGRTHGSDGKIPPFNPASPSMTPPSISPFYTNVRANDAYTPERGGSKNTRTFATSPNVSAEPGIETLAGHPASTPARFWRFMMSTTTPRRNGTGGLDENSRDLSEMPAAIPELTTPAFSPSNRSRKRPFSSPVLDRGSLHQYVPFQFQSEKRPTVTARLQDSNSTNGNLPGFGFSASSPTVLGDFQGVDITRGFENIGKWKEPSVQHREMSAADEEMGMKDGVKA